MKDKYYVISQDGDGEWSFVEYATLDAVIDDYGMDAPEGEYIEEGHPAYGFKTHVDDYNEGHVLIKGRILLPKPKEVVKRWEFE